LGEEGVLYDVLLMGWLMIEDLLVLDAMMCIFDKWLIDIIS